jgi:UDPglucose 6-dehydrogenase
MKICVVGTGYVGLVVGTCMADLGFQVTCVDNDEEKIRALEGGQVPIYEPGLDQILRRNVREKRLDFTMDGKAAIQAAEVIYIAVGTPSAPDGSADLSGVLAVAQQIGDNLRRSATVIIKSTVPVGTADQVRELIASRTTQEFDVVSNPEFLKEGAAVEDFMRPDRIVIGCKAPRSRTVMEQLYASLVRTGRPILFMDNRSAELTKYASNALLATKISFMNELSRLCEKTGADIELVRKGAGADTRIGPRFLFAGAGYGGSCFPKDVKALCDTAKKYGMTLSIADAVEQVNYEQKHVLGTKVKTRFGPDLASRRFCLWGLAFKPETDDMREAPSLVLAEDLLAAGASVVAYDPEAMQEARKYLGDRVTYAPNPIAALEGADALVLVTEWNEFRNPDFRIVKERLRQPVIFDGRNIYNREELRAAGFEYFAIGRP